MGKLSKRNKLLVLSIPLLLGIALSIYLFVTNTEYITLWNCPLFQSAGFACPGCGATRAVCMILTFRFISAFQHNALVCILLIFIVCVYIRCIYKVIKYNEVIKFNDKYILTIAIIVILFGVLRNFAFYPWQL